MGNSDRLVALKGIDIMRNYFERLVRANFRFGRMCCDVKNFKLINCIKHI